MFYYCVTIFLSAFLLFQIQPMIARLILPNFGGTAAVWTACMMFFQVTLFLGYLYAHLLRTLLRPKHAWLFHTLLTLVAAGVLWCFRPTTETIAALSQTTTTNLNGSIVLILAQTIGLPFFLLSTTGPLIQAWQATSHADRSAFRLYALSNLASVLALISYPFLVEPYLSLSEQSGAWFLGFLVFCVFTFWAGRQTIAFEQWHGAAESDETAVDTTHPNRDGWTRFFRPRLLLWFLLSMTSSVMLLATTNLMCQEVASIPFLWVVPLTLYLLSFIICFDRPAWYRRRLWMGLLGGFAGLTVFLMHLNVHAGLVLQVSGLSMVGFLVSMVCHGELERSKPDAADLTLFYLVVAIGGAAGGVFVSVLAAQIFDGFYEFHLGLGTALVVSLVVMYRCLAANGTPDRPRHRGLNRLTTLAISGCLFVSLAITFGSWMYFVDPGNTPGLVFRGRNEYGISTVVEVDGYRKFINGRVVHGGQARDPELSLEHSSYYIPGSGVAVAFEAMREQRESPLKVAVLGLGAGAMSTWLNQGDEATFFELNPMVVQIAKDYFWFLSRTLGKKQVIIGDGRVQLARTCQNKGTPDYDILFMDAFASDSVPVHLLTEECFRLYDECLAQDGILVVHISNKFIDLLPVVLHHQSVIGMQATFIDFEADAARQSSRWVLLTRNQAVLNSPILKQAMTPLPKGLEPVRWTDDYSSVAAQMNWSATIDFQALRAAFTSDSQTSTRASSN